MDQGKFAEAEPYYREALEKRRRVLGEEHPDTLVSINNMATLLEKQGRLDEAELLQRALLRKFGAPSIILRLVLDNVLPLQLQLQKL